MKRILIIEPNWLGDILFTTPSIYAIKKARPDSYITCLAMPRCTPLLEQNPDIDEIITFDQFEERKSIRNFIGRIELISFLKQKKFNTAFLFHRSMSRAVLCLFAGIPERIGYATKKRFVFLTHKVPQPKKTIHRVDHYLNIIKYAGIEADTKDYQLTLTSSEKEDARSILKNNGLFADEEYFVINPGGNWLPKRWPKKYFSELISAISKRYNIKVVVTGSGKDIDLGSEIIKLSGVDAVNLCGKTSLRELAAVLAQAKAVVANDSGPMHIAVSQKTPTVAIFGPTDPNITGPYGRAPYVVLKKDVGCAIPCYDQACTDYKCMEAVAVDDVMTAIDKLLNIKCSDRI